MSKLIATRAIRGAHKIVQRCEEKFQDVLAKKGADAPIGFPDTAYYLPLIYAMTGRKITKLGELKDVMDYTKKLLPPIPENRLWLPYLGHTLDAGMATLFAEEMIEAMRPLDGENPVQFPWLWFTTDAILREQGIKLVDGRMPGFAAIVGAAPDSKTAVKIVRELQERNILIFIAAETNGLSIADQLAEEKLDMGWDTFVVPYGKGISSAVLALNFAARSAMTFGGITPKGMKEARDILLYNKKRVHAFVLALGEVDDEKHATAAGAINFGFPTISETDIDQILPTGVCTYEHVVSPVTLDKIVNKSIEVRGLKIQVNKMPIPVPYGPAFEGERVRKENLGCEFGSKYSKAFELVRMKSLEEVENRKVTIVGPEIDSVPDAGAVPYGLVVDVAGRKMQKEFESILERRLHNFLSEAHDVMHTGQRDMLWIRIGKDARKAGLKFEHFGIIIVNKLLNDFGNIVDKAEVTIYTKESDVDRLLPEAREIYRQRDESLSGLTDDSVDTFYTCQLCQSYAPNHICIITPERLGLCGAYNWLDGKAAYEVNPQGGNQPVKKGRCIDAAKGQWEGVNEIVYQKSNKAFEIFNAYSIMEFPETSCGCFECIVALVPEANGVMVVNRGFPGMTPVGMTFSTLAGTVGGGNQIPGFIGVGRLFLTSKKFISADGGFHRIVWMPKELKDSLLEKLKKRAGELGTPDFVDKIADDTNATTTEQLVEYLTKVNHPALTMPSLL